MMVIKIRGKAVEEMYGSQWVVGTGIHTTEFTEEYAKEQGRSVDTFIYTESGWLEVHADSVGVYTGVKINETEIYEGDIVKFTKEKVRTGTRRIRVGRSYESVGIYEDKEIIGVVEKGSFKKGIRDKEINCFMVNTDETTTYEHYFWGDGKRTDRPSVSTDNLSEPLYGDKEYEVVGNTFDNK